MGGQIEERMSTKTVDRYAVFGNPIKHSLSPLLHTAFAQQTQQQISYTAECVAEDLFHQAANTFFASGGKGLNVTVPFKVEAFHYADSLSARAQLAGAVNTLIKQDQKIVGDNTDGVGLVKDITENLNWPLAGKQLLVLGAGGAVRGVLAPLLEARPAAIVVANRTLEKAQRLAEKMSDKGNISACHYNQLSGKQFDIVINGTSASLSGDLPQLPSNLLKASSACYDMVYGKADTAFMQWSRQQGAKEVADGLGMLVCQGAESFFLWRGVRADALPVIEQLRQAL